MENVSASSDRIPEETVPDCPCLQLFVAGNTIRSQSAISILRALMRIHKKENVHLEVIDIYQQPAMAREAQVIATPTLIKYSPKPKKILIGDLSRTERVLACLGWG